MVIALAVLDSSSLSVASGSPPTYNVNLRVSASDGSVQNEQPLSVAIPAGTNQRQFNDLLVGAIKTWVDSQNGWVIAEKDIYFQAFTNGS